MTTEIASNVIATYTLSPEDYYDLECELVSLRESLRYDPVANYRVTIEQTQHTKSGKTRKRSSALTKQVHLTFFINPREGRIPSEFNLRQALVLMGIEHPALNSRGKVEARWALDRLAKEFGLEWEELATRIEDIAKVKRRIKELAANLRSQGKMLS